MRSFLHKVIIVSCALYLSGAHWVLLQGTAWTGMFVSRAISTSVAEALSSTFDGQHPCAMCAAITKGRCSEEGAEANFAPPVKSQKAKFLTLVVAGVPQRSMDVELATWPVFSLRGVFRVEAPSTPPPMA
jgi:hypothetical protein